MVNNIKLFDIKFTNNSLDTYIKFIKPFINNNNVVDRNFLNEIFELLLDANEYIDMVSFIRNIKSKTSETKELLNLNSLNSNFLPSLIKKYIIETNCLIFEYKSSINGKNITINFYYYEDLNSSNNSSSNITNNDIDSSLKIYDYYAKLVLMWIYILNIYSKKKCGKNLRIDIYHTHFNKKIPDNKNDILGPLNANSAFTTNCSINSEIIIFRKEEWFKVFIHETMHNFDLDFSLMDQTIFNKNMKKIFSINSKMNIFEAYCDFWARIILSCFNSFIFLTNDVVSKSKSLNNKIEKKDFYKICDLFIEIERTFTIFQANKVLNYMNLEYTDFINDKNINDNYNKSKLLNFKEDTNIFSYYIVTAILFVQYNQFIGWCQTNNKLLFKFDNTTKNLRLFERYIKDIYTNKYIINAFSTVNILLDIMIKRNNKYIIILNESYERNKSSKTKKYYKNIKIINNLINTMRMSFIELV